MNCPFCATRAASLHEIVDHLAAEHNDKPKTLALLDAVLSDDAPPVAALRLPCVGTVDMDAIYRKRPDRI